MLVAFGFLLLMRWDVLFLPPYEDRAIAWVEGKFLANSNFDYIRLRYEEKNWMDGGGVRSYMISWVPTFTAILMREIPIPVYTFVVHHLVMFLAASLNVALAVRAIQPRAGRVIAWLAGGAILLTPTFWTQAQMIGEDTALAMFGLAGFCLLAERHYLLAGLALLLSFFTKANGMVFTLAALVYVIIGLVVGTGRWRERLWPAVVMVTVYSMELIASLWADDPAIFLRGSNWSPMLRPPEVLLFFPDVSFLWIGSILMASVFAGTCLIRAKASVAGYREALHRLWQQEPLVILSLIYLAGISVALSRYFVMMRYVVPGIPLTYIILCHILPKLGRSKVVLSCCLVGIFTLHLVNMDGRLYPSLQWLGKREFAYWTWWNPRMCGLTERSEEYRADLDRTITLMNQLETSYSKNPIYVELAYSYYLRNPEFGYIARPPAHVRQVVDFSEMIRSLSDDLASSKDPVLVWSGKTRHLLPKPDQDAEILFDDGHPILPVIVYRLRPDRVPTDPRAREDWLLDKSWGSDWTLFRVINRQNYLKETGRFDRWKSEIDSALKEPADDDYLGLREILLQIRQQDSN
jgi:hypothetical protein